METKTNETKPAETAGTTSYTDALGCVKCYAKHMSKACVQWSEYREDAARMAELALAVGNIGCAEDHAAALGREDERRRLRALRERIYTAPGSVAGELQAMAAGAMQAALVAVEAERRQAAAAKQPGA